MKSTFVVHLFRESDGGDYSKQEHFEDKDESP